MNGEDAAYYNERAAAERRLAAMSENEEVAAIHEELARQYDALVAQAELRPTLRIVVPTGGLARAGRGVLYEKSATKLATGSAARRAGSPEDSD
jgi:hypothetical protein